MNAGKVDCGVCGLTTTRKECAPHNCLAALRGEMVALAERTLLLERSLGEETAKRGSLEVKLQDMKRTLKMEGAVGAVYCKVFAGNPQNTAVF